MGCGCGVEGDVRQLGRGRGFISSPVFLLVGWKKSVDEEDVGSAVGG